MPDGFQVGGSLHKNSDLKGEKLMMLPPKNLLLSGHGNLLRVHNVATRKILTEAQVFESQCIHGIKSWPSSDGRSKLESTSLLVWGGRGVAFAKLNFSCPLSNPEDGECTLVVLREVEVSDWILDATFSPSSNPTEQVAFFVTAHNQLSSLSCQSPKTHNAGDSPIADGPRSILYSAHVKPKSATHVVVAAGTVFGEAIVWSCSCDPTETSDSREKWHSHVHKIFHGHNGSIFGVHLSDTLCWTDSNQPSRLLASCSDDRTICIWDASDERSKPSLDESIQHDRMIPQTGHESLNSTCLAVTWAHQSRIWGVQFNGTRDASSFDPLTLMSRGEDATCQVWHLVWEDAIITPGNVDFGKRHLRFKQMSSDHYHSGKHIWSLMLQPGESTPTMLAGGSDGAVTARAVTINKSNARSETSFRDLFASLRHEGTDDSFRRAPDNDSVKQYAFVSPDEVLATTNSGLVLRGALKRGKQTSIQQSPVRWSILLHAPELRGFATMAGDITRGIVYISSAAGSIWIYYHEGHSVQPLSTVGGSVSRIFAASTTITDDAIAIGTLLVCYTNSSIAKLLLVTEAREPLAFQVSKSTEVDLPSNFQPTAFLEGASGLFVLGSRSGALAVYQNDLKTMGDIGRILPVICARHIHGSDTVTELRNLPVANDMQRNAICYDFISSGRDGSYAVHRISFDKKDTAGTAPALAMLHRSRPLIGPYLEGVNLVTTDSGATDIILHGFDGKNFMVWNETSSSEVFSLSCGGAHRSWAFRAQKSTSVSGSSDYGGCFVWTKAGVLNIAEFDAPNHDIVQPGGHGREIKAMALDGGTFECSGNGGLMGQLVATGAEDTNIRLWAITTPIKNCLSTEQRHDFSKDTMTCLRILRGHTTGIQHLAFCKDYLFSSSGLEELFIWKINFGVGAIGVGTVLQAVLPKHESVSDLRITSFEVVAVSEGRADGPISASEQFLIHATYSNSMVRRFLYTDGSKSSTEDKFDLLGEGFYNTNCLTNVFLLGEPFSCLLTASTNGAVTLWPNVTGTWHNRAAVAKLVPAAEHFIHQNGVLASHIVHLASGYNILLTGGDDNAFAITLLIARDSSTRSASDSLQALLRFGTLLIPRAHAAAVTAIAVLDMTIEASLSILTVASTGNDQRVKIWRITVNIDQLSQINQNPSPGKDFGPEAVCAIDVQLVNAMWTNVADASSMIAIPDIVGERRRLANTNDEPEHQEGKGLLIAGIGMEMLKPGFVDGRDLEGAEQEEA